MKLLGMFLSLIFIQHACAQFKLINLDKNSIPKSIKYSGNIVQSVRWTDNLGSNIVLFTTTGKINNKNAEYGEYRNGELYVYHFIELGDSTRQTWKVYDHVKDCPVDMTLHFVNESFSVTDLDNDGKAEIWVMYKISCHGDVSPIPMKIIMYEEDKKYAVRGTTRVNVSSTGFIGGTFNFDDNFKNSPATFRGYAAKLWGKHKIEK